MYATWLNKFWMVKLSPIMFNKQFAYNMIDDCTIKYAPHANIEHFKNVPPLNPPNQHDEADDYERIKAQLGSENVHRFLQWRFWRLFRLHHFENFTKL